MPAREGLSDGGNAAPPIRDESARLAAQGLVFAANALPALISYLDASVRYVWVNEGYHRWFGHPHEEIVGRHPSEILGVAGWAAIKPHVERVLAGEEVTFDNRVTSNDGVTRDVRASYVPHRDQSGRVDGFVALVTDVSEMKAVETALRRSERMLEQSQATAQVGSWEVTLNEGLWEVPGTSLWSKETYRIFGYEPGTPSSLERFHQRVHPDDRTALQSCAVLAAGLGESVETEYRIVHPDGTVRVIQAWLEFERAADGNTTRARGTCQDITERKYAELEIRRAQQERERALDDLREADRRKDEFLAMLSHELRNPLAPILNGVEVLALLPPGREDLAAQFREVIARQAQHMKRLLDDLLDVSRVSRGEIRLRKEPVDLNVVLRQAAEVSRPLIIQKRQELALALAAQPIALAADPTRLVQVFDNLIDNAAKYTGLDGHISIASVVENGEAVVRVRDDGAGMTQDLLGRAFDLFTQGTRSLDRTQGGLGVGLTLARAVVEMHGGSVRAFSDGPGHGSELVVKLPLAPAAEASPRAPAPAAHDAECAALLVLVVDDNADAAASLGFLLRRQGHRVVLAHDGPAALAAASEAPPDVVVLDIGLPGMDGYTVAAKLRAAGHTDAALVALTGYGQDEDLQRSRDAGFDHHLLKPINFAELKTLLLGVRGRRP